MAIMWDIETISTDEVMRRQRLYGPLTDSIRELIDAALRTDVGDDDIGMAMADIDAASERLRRLRRAGFLGMGVTPEGESISWGNLADGVRNPLAPPLVVEHDSDTHAHIDVELGVAYEGAPGHVHGGYCALVLDHLFGYVASYGSATTVAATGTISLRYQRPTQLGHLRVEAEIERTEGRKIHVVGHIADADGVTVTAEGLFIVLRQ
jgi:acyl-coenzyme A thioesterase PaaI-like protein